MDGHYEQSQPLNALGNFSRFSTQQCAVQSYDRFSYIVRVALILPIFVLGMAANVVNVLIFQQKRMRQSLLNWYLVALALSDIGVLLSSFLMLSLPAVCDRLGTWQAINAGIVTQRWTYAFGLTMQTTSVGITVLVSGHRFFGVCFPFHAQRWCTSRSVRTAIWSVLLFSLFFNIPRWFELEICHDVTTANHTVMSLIGSQMRSNRLYYNLYMVLLYTLVMFALPFLLLIIMNAMIVRTVHQSRKLRFLLTNKTTVVSSTVDTAVVYTRVLASGRGAPLLRHQQSRNALLPQKADSEAPNGTSTKENTTTLMLIAVVLMFIVCNSLAFINNILEVLITHGVPIRVVYAISIELSNFLVVVNSSSNIFIYLAFSAKYRAHFQCYLSYVCCCCASLAQLVTGSLPKRFTTSKPLHYGYLHPRHTCLPLRTPLTKDHIVVRRRASINTPFIQEEPVNVREQNSRSSVRRAGSLSSLAIE